MSGRHASAEPALEPMRFDSISDPWTARPPRLLAAEERGPACARPATTIGTTAVPASRPAAAPRVSSLATAAAAPGLPPKGGRGAAVVILSRVDAGR